MDFLAEKFLHLPWRSIYFYIKILFILLDVALAVLFIYVFLKARSVRPDLNFKSGKKQEKGDLKPAVFRKKWDKIVSKIDGKVPGSFALAVIEADNLVNDFLIKKGIKGDSASERIKNMGEQRLYSWAQLWEAHKMRNALVHSHDSHPPREELKMAIKSYEDFLKELKVL